MLYTEFRQTTFPITLPAEYAAPLPAAEPARERALHGFLTWFQQPRLPHDPINNPLVDADFPHRVAARCASTRAASGRCCFRGTERRLLVSRGAGAHAAWFSSRAWWAVSRWCCRRSLRSCSGCGRSEGAPSVKRAIPIPRGELVSVDPGGRPALDPDRVLSRIRTFPCSCRPCGPSASGTCR